MKASRPSQKNICLPAGFSFSSACAGIKASGRPDLALVEACAGTTAAAVFTKNRVVAAPLEVGRAALAATRGRIRAVIVNSGNANCATGKPGISLARKFVQDWLNSETACQRNLSIFHRNYRRPAASGENSLKLPELTAGSQSDEAGNRRLRSRHHDDGHPA